MGRIGNGGPTIGGALLKQGGDIIGKIVPHDMGNDVTLTKKPKFKKHVFCICIN
jgi:hypothetical protein